VKQQYASLGKPICERFRFVQHKTFNLQRRAAQYNSQVIYGMEKAARRRANTRNSSQQKDALTAQQTELEAQRTQVNSLADQDQCDISKYNLLVNKINST